MRDSGGAIKRRLLNSFPAFHQQGDFAIAVPLNHQRFADGYDGAKEPERKEWQWLHGAPNVAPSPSRVKRKRGADNGSSPELAMSNGHNRC